jgi:FkbM family methyltransferase
VLLGTWLVLLVPLSVGALLLGELLLPVVMSAQSHHTIAIARLFMPTVALVLLTELVAGYIVGSKRFVMFNLLRALTPMTVGLVYVVLWRTGALSVATVVWSFAGVQVLAVVWALGRCVGWDAVSRPNLKLARQTVWYGIRAHTTNISTLLTARLDLLIMPAFLSASSVGLYSVATNVSWIVFALAGPLAVIALPVAASAGKEGSATIIRSLHTASAVAVVVAAAVAVLAGVAVRIVYGHQFEPGVLALRLLLPGTVLYAMALVLVSGLYAADRPFLAALTQGVGLVTTVIGLLLYLKSGGIEAAAIVSSVSYALVFVVALFAYQRVTRAPWRDFLGLEWLWPTSARGEHPPRRLLRTFRGVQLMLRGALHLASDRRSMAQLIFDTFMYRLLRVTDIGRGRLRTVRLLGGVTLTYRCNRGDILTVVETWMTDAYRVPVEVRPGGVILDLGANIGVTGVFLAQRYSPAAYIAVEPVPSNAALARKNLLQNAVPARVIEAAIGPEDGHVSFAESDVSTLGHAAVSGRSVPVVTVDHALQDVDPGLRIALLKMDIEGGEEALFDGPTGWLERVDCIVAEIHPDHCCVDRMLARLSAAGFVEHRLPRGDPAGREYMSCFVTTQSIG